MYEPILCSSLLSFEKEGDSGSFKHSYNNFALKQGVVIKCHEIDSESNLNNLGPEYDVVVQEQDENRGVTSTTYRNCSSIDSFGGVGDFLEAKFRPATSESYQTDQDPEDTDGAIVMMLCLDGVSKKGIIIGAVKHASRTSTLTEDNGHCLQGEFNGLNWKIDKLGALTITFKSATTNDGIPLNPAAGGTTFAIDPLGSVELSDGQTQSVKIDKTKKQINLTSASDINAISDFGNINLSSLQKINLDATAELVASAGGKAAFTASMFEMKALGSMEINSPQLKINALSSMEVTGSQVSIKAPTVALGIAPAPAVTSGTMFLGMSPLGPVMSTSIGPFSSSVQISL